MVPHSKSIEKAYAALHCAKFTRRATVFVTEKLTVKVTRQRPHDRRAKRETFLLTVGGTNYREKEFVRKVKKTGPFPDGILMVDYWPKKKKAKAKK